MPAAQPPSKSDDMAPRQNPRDEVIQLSQLSVQHLGVHSTASIRSSSSIYSMTIDTDISPRTSVIMGQDASNDDRRTFTSRRSSESARSIDGPSFRDVDWTKGRRAETRHPERSTNLEKTHERQEPKEVVAGFCLLTVKASMRRRRKRVKGRTGTGASSSDAHPQGGPQPVTSEAYSTLTGNGPYGMQMQTGVTTTDRDHSSLDHRGYNSETDSDSGSDYDGRISNDDKESDYIGSDQDDADQDSAVYLNSEYAETSEINNAFGDGRYVLSPDGSLVARRDLGPLDSLRARAAPKIRAWRQVEATVIGRVSDGANGMARAIKRMLEKAGAKLAPVLTSNESEGDEPAVEVRIHERAEGAREYERRVLATCCMHHLLFQGWN